MPHAIDRQRIAENTRYYDDSAKALRFLMGGIGTGNISLDSRGALQDFEFFSSPNKGLKLPYYFFSIWSHTAERGIDARVLEARYRGPCGVEEYAASNLGSLPRFDSSRFWSHYPFANVALQQKDLPLDVVLEAFTPFIPLNTDDSSIPGAIFRYQVKNRSAAAAQVAVCGSLSNVCGMRYFDGNERLFTKGENHNAAISADGVHGVHCTCENVDANDIAYGSLSMATPDGNASIKPLWQDGGWWDGAEEFWADFREDGWLEPDVANAAKGSLVTATESRKVGSVCVNKSLQPGEEAVFTFYLTWYFPNRWAAWWPDGHRLNTPPEHLHTIRNYYATRFESARHVAEYLAANEIRLQRESRLFADAIYAGTIDPAIIDALADNLTVMRSTTCFRVEDGTFYAWEGSFSTSGSCPGNCTHVWNYAQSLAFLFPELERSMRRTEFLVETEDDGEMAFRAKRQLEGRKWEMLPAADGQLGSILRVYREWMLSGDNAFLQQLWPNVKKAMHYALRVWDLDGDFVLEGRQHNTYDIEFRGITALTNTILYAALEAYARMAELQREPNEVQWARQGRVAGSKRMDELLWNGRYYVQHITEEELQAYRYQLGSGCLSDQLLGQQLAHLYGLGDILPREHVREALQSIYRYNFRADLSEHHSVQRSYGANGEAGLLLCTWPDGGRPKQPFVYSDEVWTGTEYQVAAHLIYEGMAAEGIAIVKAVRDRYDGHRRNPYNEMECGNHYARSLASWSLLIACSGFRYDPATRTAQFSPSSDNGHFSCFFSTGSSWGIYTQNGQEKTLEVLYGDTSIALGEQR